MVNDEGKYVIGLREIYETLLRVEERMNNQMVTTALHSQRLDNLEKDIEELKTHSVSEEQLERTRKNSTRNAAIGASVAVLAIVVAIMIELLKKGSAP